MKYEFDVQLKPVWHKPAPKAQKVKIPGILRALVLAHQIDGYMRENNLLTIKDFCRRAKITPARGTQLMRLLQLSPRIQTEILSGKNIGGNHAEHNIRHIAKEVLWPANKTIAPYLHGRQNAFHAGCKSTNHESFSAGFSHCAARQVLR